MALTYYNNNSISNITSFAQVPSGSLTLLSTATASGSSSISFTSGIDSTYDVYKFIFINMHPSADSPFAFQVSTNGGSSYGITITSTAFRTYHNETDSYTDLAYEGGTDLAQSTSYQRLLPSPDTANDSANSGEMYLFAPSSTTYVKHFIHRLNCESGGASVDTFVAGYVNSTSSINAINFKFESGNIDAGTIKMYGIKA